MTEQTQNTNRPQDQRALVAKQKMDSLKALLTGQKFLAELQAVVPVHMKPEKLVKIALVAASRNPLLLQCSQASILKSLMIAGQLGLEPDGTLGSAYLVPYRNRKTGQYEAQLIPGYRGLIDLARRSGQIRNISARVVYERDKFEVHFGTEDRIIHEPSWEEDPGKLKAVYAVAWFKDGSFQAEFMTRAQVDAIRARSMASGSGPWASDYDEMARKTVVRRLCKYLPLSPELAAAVALDNLAESGGDQKAVIDAIGISFEGIDPDPEALEQDGGVFEADQEVKEAAPKTQAANMVEKVRAQVAAKSNGEARVEANGEAKPEGTQTGSIL